MHCLPFCDWGHPYTATLLFWILLPKSIPGTFLYVRLRTLPFLLTLRPSTAAPSYKNFCNKIIYILFLNPERLLWIRRWKVFLAWVGVGGALFRSFEGYRILLSAWETEGWRKVCMKFCRSLAWERHRAHGKGLSCFVSFWCLFVSGISREDWLLTKLLGVLLSSFDVKFWIHLLSQKKQEFCKWNQLGSWLILAVFRQFYLKPLHVSDISRSTIRRNNCIYATFGRLQLKCDGTQWHTGGEVKGKLANRVGSQYYLHYLGTQCIQPYYRWYAHLGCQYSAELTPYGRFKWTRPFSTKEKIWFLRVCHHISTGLYINTSTIHVHFSRLQPKCDGTRWRREGKWRGNWRMEWVSSTLHTTSEHGVSSITTADGPHLGCQ